MAAAARPGPYRKLVALWKQGWNEIPEVMGAGCYGVLGFFGCLYGLHLLKKYDKNNHRYKIAYTVYRPEDERVKRIRKFDDSPGVTRTPPSLR